MNFRYFLFTAIWKHAKIEFEKLQSMYIQKFGKLFPFDKQWLNKNNFNGFFL